MAKAVVDDIRERFADLFGEQAASMRQDAEIRILLQDPKVAADWMSLRARLSDNRRERVAAATKLMDRWTEQHGDKAAAILDAGREVNHKKRDCRLVFLDLQKEAEELRRVKKSVAGIERHGIGAPEPGKVGAPSYAHLQNQHSMIASLSKAFEVKARAFHTAQKALTKAMDAYLSARSVAPWHEWTITPSDPGRPLQDSYVHEVGDLLSAALPSTEIDPPKTVLVDGDKVEVKHWGK